MSANLVIDIFLGLSFFIQGVSALLKGENDRLAVSFMRRYPSIRVLKFMKVHGIVCTTVGAIVLVAPLIKAVGFSTIMLGFAGALLLVYLAAYIWLCFMK